MAVCTWQRGKNMLNIYFISKVLKMHFTLFSCLKNSKLYIFTRQMVLCMNYTNSMVCYLCNLFKFIYLLIYLFIYI